MAWRELPSLRSAISAGCILYPSSLENENAIMPHPQSSSARTAGAPSSPTTLLLPTSRIAAEAIAAYIHAKEDPKKGLCIGYDTRFGSKALLAAVLRWPPRPHSGHLANDITPTPALSFGVRERKAAGRHHAITSSQQSAQWNGVKYKAWYARLGKPSIITEIESYLASRCRAAQP